MGDVTLSLSALTYLGALVLAAVFVVGGAAKLAWPADTRTNLKAFGIPRPHLVATALPLVELGLGVLLIAAPRVGGAMSLVALAAFTAVLARRLRDGVDAPCGCIGSPRNAKPLRPTALLRNAELAVLALGALVAEPAWPSAAEVLLVAVVVAAGWALLTLLESRTRVAAG